MSQQRKPLTCQSCGQTYVVEEVSEIYLDHPVSYGKGMHRFCLACWLGVGPNDQPSLFQEEPGPGGRSVREIGKKQRKLEIVREAGVRDEREKKSEAQQPALQGVYLWLHCEGEMRFGPFEWLSFDDEKGTISDANGEVVARKESGRWRVTGEKWQSWQFSDPMITTSLQYPNRNNRSSPRIRTDGK